MFKNGENREEERNLVEIAFVMPIALKILYILCIVSSLVAFIICAVDSNSNWGYCLVSSVLISILFGLHLYCLTKCSCKISNKRIYGTNYFLIFEKSYSYRLDEIDNVELSFFLGIPSLKLHFLPATTSPSAFFKKSVVRLSLIKYPDDVYDSLAPLVSKQKSPEHLLADIKKETLALKQKEIDAIEKLSEKTNNEQA